MSGNRSSSSKRVRFDLGIAGSKRAEKAQSRNGGVISLRRRKNQKSKKKSNNKGTASVNSEDSKASAKDVVSKEECASPLPKPPPLSKSARDEDRGSSWWTVALPLYLALIAAAMWFTDMHVLLHAGIFMLVVFGIMPDRVNRLFPFLGVRSAFGFDPESLAAFRVALGFGVLIDLAFRWGVVHDFYTDDGVMPRDDYLSMCRQYSVCDYEYPSTRSQQSLHMIGGSFATATLLWALHSILALGLIVGYKTRACSILVWFMTESLHMRNHFLNDKGAMTLRVYLFWGMLLPLGCTGSVDAALRAAAKDVKSTQRVLSAATVALCIQVGAVYWFSIVYKWRVPNSSWKDGTALEHSFNMINYKKPLSALMMAYLPYCSQLGTYTGVFVESYAPFLLFIPFLSRRVSDVTRCLGAGLFLLFHALIGMTLDIGIFAVMSCIPFIAFFPGSVYSGAVRMVSADDYFSTVVDAARWVEDVLCIGTRYSERVSESAERAQRVIRMVVHAFTIFCIGYVLTWNRVHFDHKEYKNMGFKEIGAFLGLRQHWKLFTDMRPVTGNYDDCRPVFGGQLNGTDDRTFSFMDYRSRHGQRNVTLDMLIRPMDATIRLKSSWPFPRLRALHLEDLSVVHSGH